MLKITALAVGFLTIVTIAPARSTNFPIDRTQSVMSSKLYAEKIVPVKKSVKLAPTAIKSTSVSVPVDRKPEPSPASKEPQPIKSQSQRELEDRSWLRPNERPINIWDNSRAGNSLNGFSNFHNFNR